ncbi:uncharacterized protein LAJ45_03146 [Morchella importuna]|uniref:Uncharacterized protein n=1 Tax=Morchella conica CCBAS932 TaxID=1392247 RepID=A0A3N4L4N4_9PEZI|nr:uncharacterized protein LAJ45_03146 [Morchella importuna]KAH8152920.1 hypothetical protein LAJ45_03146 [Morchella importuna]RPB12985.1 hypothetical protein P167DRAFT_505799 [Morchella conica CCBAS932]
MPLLPTPDTSHVDYDQIYEPSEDSYLLLDTLSSDSEISFLKERFPTQNAVPIVLEVGTGSGVVLSFLTTNSSTIFGHDSVLTLGIDVSTPANKATNETISRNKPRGHYLDSLTANLVSPLRDGTVDMLVFNPPYVPTSELPILPGEEDAEGGRKLDLLELTYAGGPDGMLTTDRLLDSLEKVLSKDRGVAYILLCAQNKPEAVAERLRSGRYGEEGIRWQVEKVGSSGKKGGWEVLGIWRIWR